MTTTTDALRGNLVETRRSTGLWSDAFTRLRKNRLAMVGLILVILLAFVAIIGPFIAPYPYQAQDLAAVMANGGQPVQPGDPAHILGTDRIGRDLLSRLLDGARISLTVAIVVQLVVLGIGVPIGAIAGWFGGRADNLLMRFTDMMYAFPDLLFIILLSVAFRETAFGKAMDGLLLVFVAIGLTIWVTVARLVRGQLLSLKETEFVEAARAIGVSDRKIVTKPPAAKLGRARSSSRSRSESRPRSWPRRRSRTSASASSRRARPGAASSPKGRITSAPIRTSSSSRRSASPSRSISFTFLGDGLRDALDPKLKGKQ